MFSSMPSSGRLPRLVGAATLGIVGLYLLSVAVNVLFSGSPGSSSSPNPRHMSGDASSVNVLVESVGSSPASLLDFARTLVGKIAPERGLQFGADALRFAQSNSRMTSLLGRTALQPGAVPAAVFTPAPMMPETCEPLQLASVVGGVNSVPRFSTLLKSLLMFRKQPIHFHLLVDTHSEETLKTLLYSWDIPSLNVSYYRIADHFDAVKSVPTNHYSSMYVLIKLMYPRILASIPRVLCLDTDLVFLTDVGRLWEWFRSFTDTTAIAAIENQSEWYMRDETKMTSFYRRFPADGRGFNTGVMLLDLARLRGMNWDKMWSEEAEYQLKVAGVMKAALGDQDVYNAVVKRRPEIYMRLPCGWNVQLSESSHADLCYKNYPESIFVIHWNRPMKFGESERELMFGPIYRQFVDLDSEVLRRPLSGCPVPETSDFFDLSLPRPSWFAYSNKYDRLKTYFQRRAELPAPGSAAPSPDSCDSYRRSGAFLFRTHTFYFGLFNESVVTPGGNDITLVSQLSASRLYLLERLIKRWAGPLSIAIYLRDSDLEGAIAYLEDIPAIRERGNIGIHFVFKSGRFYPVNYLRNVAYDASISKFVFLMDIDFLPPFSLMKNLKTTLFTVYRNNLGKRALVVPAFETFRYQLAADFPSNKDDLIVKWDTGVVFPFRVHEWPQGHRPTEFDRFRNATEPYTIQWGEDFEPYVIVDREIAPRYDLRFVGFGWNKVAQIYEMKERDFEYVVLPNTYIIHLPHSPSDDITMYRSSGDYRACLQVLKAEFIEDLRVELGKPPLPSPEPAPVAA